MNTYCDVLSFRSSPEYFKKEYSGVKNNTVRLLTEAEFHEVQIVINRNETVYIRIAEHLGVSENGIKIDGRFFFRRLRDITFLEDDRINYYIGIFTWDLDTP
jgi:hypothetical protein